MHAPERVREGLGANRSANLRPHLWLTRKLLLCHANHVAGICSTNNDFCVCYEG